MMKLTFVEIHMAIEQIDVIADDPDANLYEGQMHSMIAELAYTYAEERGFEGGDPVEDWLRAESAIKKTLAGEQGSRVF
jgi:hypothetical protein